MRVHKNKFENATKERMRKRGMNKTGKEEKEQKKNHPPLWVQENGHRVEFSWELGT